MKNVNMDAERAAFDVMGFIKAVTGVDKDSYIGIGRMENGRMVRENGTVHELQEIIDKMMGDNFWFCASALRSEEGQTVDDCVCTQSILVDLDYGITGHRKPSFFQNEDEALNCLRSLPLTPQLAWNTAHGLQAAFLLDAPVYYADQERAELLEETKRHIYFATKSDYTQSVEHLFRVPCSINIKPGCEPIRGRMVKL